MKFEILKVISMKITVVSGVTPYSLVDGYQCFRGSYCFHLQDKRTYFFYPKMEAAGSSETLVPIFETAWCHIPKGINLDFQWFVLMILLD
jgi:hypothetical protein